MPDLLYPTFHQFPDTQYLDSRRGGGYPFRGNNKRLLWLLKNEFGMDLEQLLEDVAIENAEIEYKHEEESHLDIVKEATSFANSGSGAIIIGVAENEDGFVVTGVENPQKLEEDISQTIDQRVSPRIEPTIEVHEFGEKSVVILEVSGGSEVHSYGIDPPKFPARQGSTTIYLNGEDLRYRYRHQMSGDEGDTEESGSDQEQENQTLEPTYHWLDHGPHFIPKTDGEIASVCTFGELYLPANPVRMSARVTRPTMDTVEHVFARLAETFDLDNARSHFTINQNQAAWAGSGLSTFFEEIESQGRRYENAGLDPSQLYKCEEAVYVANTSIPYSESVLMIYVEPWVSDSFARHFQIVLLTDGMPVDTEPLTELGKTADVHFGTAESVEVDYKSVPNPEDLPFRPIERIRNHEKGDDGEETIGILAENPFHGKADLAARVLGVTESTPLVEFQYAFGHFLNLPPEELPEISPTRFRVVDYGELAGFPLNALHADFQLNW